jgi:predicted phosphodiesterase
MACRFSLPESAHSGESPFHLDDTGWWWVLSDTHIPNHDRVTLEVGARQAKKRKIKGVLILGDFLDAHEISRHDKDPSATRYVEEIEAGKKCLAWLRGKFPGARIVFKCGNHDARLERYIIEKAPALIGLEGLSLPDLLHLKDHGVEMVNDRRVLALGKLNLIHGHEYRGGSGCVNPARWIYLKARSVVMIGHFHRTSEHHSRNIRGKAEAAWSLGCCCSLSPYWLPINDWNHGFAFVDVHSAGDFFVDNRRVLDGKLV